MKIFLKKIATVFNIFFHNKLLRRPDFSEKRIFLQGKLNEERILKKDKILDFKDVEFSVFSQFGEDGIICWLIHNIPNIKKTFVEIGTEDYWESNTRFLLKSQNWKGYLIEASKTNIEKIKKQRIYWQHRLKTINTFIDKGNINSILNENLEEKDVGILSIDIDGNDYWILREINSISPTVIICEFNTLFGDQHQISIPYEKNFNRKKSHFSKIYFGASISAFKDLLEEKGYTFLGTSSTGVNAFFIRDEYKESLIKKIKNIKSYPSVVRESHNKNSELDFSDIKQQLEKIKNMEVIDIKDNKKKKLSEFDDLYSKSWLDIFN
tara:strand:- start:600 stop:1568 length:969 start_codon:yes stop_codon:yes gene_type:complete